MKIVSLTVEATSEIPLEHLAKKKVEVEVWIPYNDIVKSTAKSSEEGSFTYSFKVTEEMLKQSEKTILIYKYIIDPSKFFKGKVFIELDKHVVTIENKINEIK